MEFLPEMCQAPEWDTNTPFGPSWELRPQVESPRLLQFAGHWGLFAFFAGPIATPMEERQMKTVSSDGDKTGWGHSLTFPGMLAPRALVPCQSGTRNRLTRQDAFASIPAAWAAHRVRPRALRGWRASDRPQKPALSEHGCRSLSYLYRAGLSAWQHEKMFWCCCWWPPTY